MEASRQSHISSDADAERMGAAVDATAVEPLADDSRLWTLPNVILTPHSSALTPELYEMRRQAFKANLRLFADGKPLENICDKTAGF